MLGRLDPPRWALEVLPRWRYRGGARDERLDLLRGFAVLAMVVDHVGGESSWLYAITGGDHFVVSAAEVFVLIAGITMGMVYPRVIATRGSAAAVRKALGRSAKLYALTVALTIAFAGAAALLSLPWAPNVAPGEWGTWLAEVVTLRRTFYLADIILMYAVIVAAAGPVLVLLARGYTRAVLLGSWLLWGAWQLSPNGFDIPWHIADNEMFNYAVWQVMFVTGIVVGYHRQTIARRLSRLSPVALAAASGCAVAVALLALVSMPHAEGARSSIGGMVVNELGGKADVSLARLAMLVLLMTFAYSLATVCWRPLVRGSGWLLMPLGQHALFAYVAHLGVVTFLGAFFPTWNVARAAGEAALIQAVGVAIVWGLVLALEAVRARPSEARVERVPEARSQTRALEMAAERAE